jgi:hypothetical protein
VNRSKTEAASVITGKSLGIPMPPLIILITEIPTAMIRKRTANPIDSADVNLNESAIITENTAKFVIEVLHGHEPNNFTTKLDFIDRPICTRVKKVSIGQIIMYTK